MLLLGMFYFYFIIGIYGLGGGGYTIENVSRLWAYETALALNKEIPKVIPMSD